MRDEVALERGLAALKTEVAEARRLQPNFEGKLNVLQGQIEKVQKTTSRLRAEQSTLEFKQRKVVQDTTVKLTGIGKQTREVLQRLRENGFELMDEMRSPSGRVS